MGDDTPFLYQSVGYLLKREIFVMWLTGSGSGYLVWVIDTGVLDTHPEFGGRAQQVVNLFGDTDNVSI